MGDAVLVLTPDADLPEPLAQGLRAAGFASVTVAGVDDAVRYLERHEAGLCLADVSFAEPLLARLKEQRRYERPPLVVMDAAPDVDRAVHLVRQGASDYVGAGSTGDVLGRARRHFARPAPSGPIFAAPSSRRCAELARRVAGTDVSVLVTGESGSGKEIIARTIHEHSRRSAGPFVAINCAAIPDNMLEAILFGHVKGAFTGAHQHQSGKFELADGGTLLLDEISEMPLTLQAKLLRVLQEREVERIGAKAPVTVDVRVIATTNVDVRQAVADGRFREDLYYRLSVFPLALAPLRERREDILELAEHFLAKHAPRQGACAQRLSAEARAALEAYRWPGNVRELENVIQRALVLCGGEEIAVADLGLPAQPAVRPGEETLAGQRQDAEAEVIRDALAANGQRRRETAAQLGISERTLRYKIRRLKDAGVEV